MVHMPHWPKPLGFRPSDLLLDRMIQILNNLGNPEKKLPPVIHVAGTNGKGSTIAFINSILRAAGLKVHVYTSPHLVDFNERIILNGEKICDGYLHEILEECREASKDIPLTFFEGTTTAALLAFSRVDADIVLIETGMGGRLDATNVVYPIVTIITSISLEHIESLGETLELIAIEKAGIMKHNTTCVIAPQESESVMTVLEKCAIKKKSIIYRGGIDWCCNKSDNMMVFSNNIETSSFPMPGLLGDHQIINAGNAISTCSILSGKFNYKIDYDDITQGLSEVYWPARLEKIKKGVLFDMLPKLWSLFLDGAHNPAGAKVLSNWMKQQNNDEIYVICGMTRDKDTIAFLGYLKPFTKHLCSVCVKYEPRAQTAQEILQAALYLNMSVSTHDTLRSAVGKILSIGNQNSSVIILICGSLFLAGDVLSENLLD
ncbi:bifunctional folylpolyglutamate synthase/dihydrofolate synthase [Neoehrlichia mikurensis]|uniref:Dihydrofolate synthase/folylpolyglutamate synthase n=1 Tax=Neoehrlichia mikurensis TaxID=89586 RepID=A0A9Q9F3D0_9RICK|nr:folylpolyglutamate synthase/dihydrofolate synthase family protein [Neoehrlichia mikurensis]QXK92009.1 bifunctional folylpolyglutamate synthase/dihydrofolate synthase [Neoehrlichia mikurensis]QXK92466.1 bifunctional folylpolyglutamate synthase/dihydrofolate synthase [Neoehrlichia mikurensis]QXK93702.1 bifunctional folylpolyglutamate synthase/dihydrofolate synthase [Neoehrlichia mikurensis]UTO55325.1 bifunctional folylpolyglutamate synthase/dihydrofolate synthase [Neoehrlichia mikurensis]UTO5